MMDFPKRPAISRQTLKPTNCSGGHDVNLPDSSGIQFLHVLHGKVTPVVWLAKLVFQKSHHVCMVECGLECSVEQSRDVSAGDQDLGLKPMVAPLSQHLLRKFLELEH